MKASRCPTVCAVRMLAVLTTTVLMVQCSMPPQQAWRSIQTKGLLTYLSSPKESPPFRAGGSSPQRNAAYPQQRSAAASNWYSNSNGYAPNSYFSMSSSGSESSRYVPRLRPSPPSGERSLDVKIPVEEPTHTPQPHIADNPPPVSSTLYTNVGTTTDSLPYGSAVPGRMNMVNSPFAGKTQLVDVSGMSAGQTVKCPYTGKLFKVPPTQQAANRTEPRLEAKIEVPKLSDEPNTGDKKP